MNRYSIHEDNFFSFYKRILKFFFNFSYDRSLWITLNLTLLLVISVKLVETENFSLQHIKGADGSSDFILIRFFIYLKKCDLSTHIILGQGEIEFRLSLVGYFIIYQMHACLNCLSCSMFIPNNLFMYCECCYLKDN